jgi:hypothetical protein
VGGAVDAASPIRWQRRIEFCETDAAGIAHFSPMFPCMEQAEHALFRSLGTSVLVTVCCRHFEGRLERVPIDGRLREQLQPLLVDRVDPS